VHLALGLHERGWDVTVVTFYEDGALGGELRDAGVPLVPVGKSGRWDVLSFGVRLVAELRRRRPQVLHGVLDVPNLIAALAVLLLPGTRLVWGVRGSQRDRRYYDRLHALTLSLERLVSWRCDLLVVNSRAGARHVEALGWRPRRVVVVPNGIEDAAGGDGDRHGGRADLGLAPADVAVGVVGRLDPIKGHEDLLRALPAVLSAQPATRLVVIGDGPEAERRRLRALAAELGVADRVVWAGQRQDMAQVYAALDLLVSASHSEGFSNAVAEGMLAGLVPVVTDVGDSRMLIGDVGTVAPPQDPAALAEALISAVRLPPAVRSDAGGRARSRVLESFSVYAMVGRTEAELVSLLQQ